MDFITTTSTDDFLIRVAHNLDYLLVTPEALVQMTRFGYDATRSGEIADCGWGGRRYSPPATRNSLRLGVGSASYWSALSLTDVRGSESPY